MCYRVSLILGVLLMFLSGCDQSGQDSGQEPRVESSLVKTPSSFFPDKKTQVMVVGTFHFHYPGLDARKTDNDKKVDVLTPRRQEEMTELVEYIRQFKPTKIGLEAKDATRLTNDLRKYKSRTLPVSRDERYQLGLRLAAELALDTLYAMDAGSFLGDLQERDEEFVMNLAEGYDFKSDSRLDSLAGEWLQYEDQLKNQLSLLQYFRHMNSPESHRVGYGLYLFGDFKLGEHRGADVLASYWYNRNLRIFRKLQRITDGPEDRILLIIGNGHAALLRQFLECSPEYDFVEFDSLGPDTSEQL